MKKMYKKISSYRKNYKIRFVGITDDIFWANFGVPVTSIFVKNSQKGKSILFGVLRNCGGKTEPVFAPFFLTILK